MMVAEGTQVSAFVKATEVHGDNVCSSFPINNITARLIF